MSMKPHSYAEKRYNLRQIVRPGGALTPPAVATRGLFPMPSKHTPNAACVVCDAPMYRLPYQIKRGHARYCSKACESVGRSAKVERTCQHCGESFTVHRFRASAKYCSLPCKYAADMVPRTAVERDCLHCGTRFTTTLSDISKGRGKHCSKRCQSAARTTRIQQTCAHCGKTFAVQPHVLAKGQGTACSVPCRIALTVNENNRDRNSYFYREWRKSVFERDHYTCQTCGQVGGELHAHHVKGWVPYPELRFDVGNGVTLCRDCHKSQHVWLLRNGAA